MSAWLTRTRIIFLLILLSTGIAVFVGLRRSMTRVSDIPVLMYHRIGDGGDSPWWVLPGDFENHLKSLRENGYKSVLPSDLVAHQRWGWPLPQKPVIITFDDGYLNILENAEPLMKKYGFRGVSYLITGLVADSPETRKACEGTPVLSWPEVRAMQKRGTIVFGGHSRTHVNLRALADPREEIAGCYRDLRKKGRLDPEGFCFPFGQYKAETLACLKKSRFTTGMTCEDGFARIEPGAKLLELPRVVVMGGRHVFHAEQGGTGTMPVSIRISQEGRDLEVCPRLAWKDGDGTAAGVWLPRVQVSTLPATLSWPREASQGKIDPQLELWDNFHVVQYWCMPLLRGLSAR